MAITIMRAQRRRYLGNEDSTAVTSCRPREKLTARRGETSCAAAPTPKRPKRLYEGRRPIRDRQYRLRSFFAFVIRKHNKKNKNKKR